MYNLLLERQQPYQFDPETPFKINPTLVHATLAGYDTTRRDLMSPFSLTAQAFMMPCRKAMMASSPKRDQSTGPAFAAGILSARRQTERSGTAQTIETSLFEDAA